MSHHGDMLSDGKEMSPKLENCIVLTWLRLIHYGLPKLVKQQYGTELRSRTFVSIKPDISQALQSLLDEIRSADDAKVIRTAALPFKKSSSGVRQQGSTPRLDPRERCKLAGRAEFRQFLNTCKYLTKNDRKCMNKARQIVGIIDDQSDDAYADCQYDSHTPVNEVDPAPNVPIHVRQSFYICTFYHHRHRHRRRRPPRPGRRRRRRRHHHQHRPTHPSSSSSSSSSSCKGNRR